MSRYKEEPVNKNVFFRGVLPVLTGILGLVSNSVKAEVHLPTDTQSEQIADAIAASSGEYNDVNLDYIHALGMQQKAWNNPLAHMGAGQSKPGYSKYNWTPDTVLPVRVREGMMTLINLPSWELIEKVHIGSPDAFNGEVVSANSVMIYADPSSLGVDGNMIVFGHSGNRYAFYLRSETFNTDKITQTVVDVLVGSRWTPVAKGGQLQNESLVSTMASMPVNQSGVATSVSTKVNSVAQNKASEWGNTVPMDPEQLKFDLDMFLPNPDDVDIAPDNVWRDNIFTYIDLGPKALTMTQRPVVSLLVQGTEVPVGFRTRGANSRLIVVEAVGDLVLRNGQKVICIKLRRDPAAGLEYTDYSGYAEQPYAYHDQLPVRASDVPNSEVTVKGGSVLHGQNPYVPAQNAGTMTLGYATETGGLNPYAGAINPYCNGSRTACGVVNTVPVFGDTAPVSAPAVGYDVSDLSVVPEETISVEFGTSPEISELEKLWEQIYASNADLLGGYVPYYSVDTAANGGVADTFRLRVGSLDNAKMADTLCRKLGKRGYSCSVIRVK